MNSRLRFERTLDRGSFLALLWAHFGPASARAGGFEYHLRDRETGLAFTAYCGPSGPSYGGDLGRRHALRSVIEAFERTLDATDPVDCAMVYGAELEYGSGARVLGWKQGHSFDLEDRRNRRTAPPDRRVRAHR